MTEKDTDVPMQARSDWGLLDKPSACWRAQTCGDDPARRWSNTADTMVVADVESIADFLTQNGAQYSYLVALQFWFKVSE